MKHRIYLDNCCFNRPYDDQSNLLVYLEAEAKLFIQQSILKNIFELAWSYVLDYENSANPYQNRKLAITKWKGVSVIDVEPSDSILNCGSEIMRKGIKNKDALHIACAIEAKCEFFLTTDKKLLRTEFDNIKVISPIDFIKTLEK